MSETSPGKAFAAAYATQGTQAAVEFGTNIADAFPAFKHRPRIAVRGLFKRVTVDRPQVRYWYETHPRTEPTAPVEDVKLRPEAAFEFHSDAVPLKPTTGWLQLPPELLGDPEALATFIDYRLLVRLNTAENQALTLGPGGDRVRGLLETPGIARLPPRQDPISSLLAACDRVEQMGGSADGVIINSEDFYRYFVGRGSLLADLAATGIRLARTRMVSPGTVITGDFTAGATLFDSGRSSIRFAEPPPGTFPRAGLAIRGDIYQALAVHLPTHFFVASLV